MVIKQKKLVSGNIYNVDFRKDENTQHMQGKHPAIVIKLHHEKDLFLAIPLTSYSDEKLEKYKNKDTAVIYNRKKLGFAKLNKIETIEENKILNPWMIKENKEQLRLTKKELDKTIKKVKSYMLKTVSLLNDDQYKYDRDLEKLKDWLDTIIKEKRNVRSIDTKYYPNIPILEIKNQVHTYFKNKNYIFKLKEIKKEGSKIIYINNLKQNNKEVAITITEDVIKE